MTVREDAEALLTFLAEAKAEDDPRQGHHALSGDVITEHLGMTPLRVNDATAVLERGGYVKPLRSLGTAPYTFMEVSATPSGRHANEERKGRLEEVKRRKKMDDGSWDAYPESDAAELVPLLRRTAFDRDVQRACAEATSNRPVALLMVDIDHFKQVNDTFGHQGGDQVLIGVAEILRRVAGRKGRTYRYGGEEMSAILPDFARDEALATAERFRLAVERRSWEDAGFPALCVTVSVGVSECPAIGAEHDALVATADKALYRAKENGRNRVEVAGP